MIRRLKLFLTISVLCTLFVAVLAQKKSTPATTANIKISNFKFEPKVVNIKVGTTVTWTVDGGTHTVISDGSTFTSPNLSQGKSFSHQFMQPGKYPYYCSFHGDKGGKDMSGTIIVTK